MSKSRLSTMKSVRDIKKRLRRHDLRIVELKLGNHIKATLSDDRGRRLNIIMPATPSDHRWIKNKMAEILLAYRNMK